MKFLYVKLCQTRPNCFMNFYFHSWINILRPHKFFFLSGALFLIGIPSHSLSVNYDKLLHNKSLPYHRWNSRLIHIKTELIVKGARSKLNQLDPPLVLPMSIWRSSAVLFSNLWKIGWLKLSSLDCGNKLGSVSEL